ncbi:methyltransferase domain-containing protein [Limibacter armeniacum]|uniref:class I SAM-dependent methyltransferase n=1 Tax=Limibacter armeniacum TaxID=466084 RepID=UPI002FE5F600
MSHYNKEYFDWQKNIGAFGGSANLFKFDDFVREDTKVIDFGSGGGFLLSNMKSTEKVGVEINPVARENANKMGIKTVEDANELENEWADVIISNHALEHVESPLDELKKLNTKLKKGGKIVFVVPYERNNKYKEGDINFHLYTWSEMNLGNLFSLAGFKVISVGELKHKWPPKFAKIRQVFGDSIFHLSCKIYGRISTGVSQIRIVAEK